MRAWSLYSRSGGKAYAGHTGYDDVAGSHYSYDDRVPNHRRVRVGDVAVIRDGAGSTGVAVVTDINAEDTTKTYRRCPRCSTSEVERRKSRTPAFRCTNGHEFEAPKISEEPVRRFRAEFGTTHAYTDALTANDLERLSLARSRQNAIRELDLDGVLALLRRHGAVLGFIARNDGVDPAR